MEVPVCILFVIELRALSAGSVNAISSQMLRQAAAEFAGVMFIVIFGCGAISQVNLSTDTLVSPSPRGVSISTAESRRIPLIYTFNTTELDLYQFWNGIRYSSQAPPCNASSLANSFVRRRFRCMG